jgi:hypothetical protein
MRKKASAWRISVKQAAKRTTGIAAVPAVAIISNEEAEIRAALRSVDLEETLRASAQLLDFASEAGNRDADGFLVSGVARALQLCADRIAQEREP